MSSAGHNHQHDPNKFAVIPTSVRLNADAEYTGKGVTIAFLDSGFYPHPDLLDPVNRIVFYRDMSGERASLDETDRTDWWQWHGTQTSVVATGNGALSNGAYGGLAPDASLVLVKVSEKGRVTEENIARGIVWVIENRERFNIRVLNISLGGDQDVECTRSVIDQAAEEAVRCGIVVIAAAGNSVESRSIPPANSPSVITVGGYHDNNQLDSNSFDLYHSNFGATADGTVKPEVLAPAMWVAAPILPNTNLYTRAEALSRLASTPDYRLTSLARELEDAAELPEDFARADASLIRDYVENALKEQRIVAAHYQHVDGTSFAAPIVTSIVAQMIEANPGLTPAAIKNILVSTAKRIDDQPAIRQGFGVVDAQRAVQLARQEQHLVSVGPRLSEGNLSFEFHDDKALSVSVCGDFNGWSASSNPLSRDESGIWKCSMKSLSPGKYEYKFVIDHERWIEDPSNGLKTSDGYGGLNSVLVVQ